MPIPNPKRLFVEGQTDLRVIPYLMEANGVAWPNERRPVEIRPLGGKQLDPEELSSELKGHELHVLGVILDADDDAEACWQRVRGWFEKLFPDLPKHPLAEGFVSQPNEMGKRLGVWIMPDNQSRGMLETFLMFLAPDDQDPLVKYAATARDRAKKLKAPFKKAHEDKAKIHTWLAWQDEPGPQLHEAVDRRVLDPVSPHSQPFVAWFRKLYAL